MKSNLLMWVSLLLWFDSRHRSLFISITFFNNDVKDQRSNINLASYNYEFAKIKSILLFIYKIKCTSIVQKWKKHLHSFIYFHLKFKITQPKKKLNEIKEIKIFFNLIGKWFLGGRWWFYRILIVYQSTHTHEDENLWSKS